MQLRNNNVRKNQQLVNIIYIRFYKIGIIIKYIYKCVFLEILYTLDLIIRNSKVGKNQH